MYILISSRTFECVNALAQGRSKYEAWLSINFCGARSASVVVEFFTCDPRGQSDGGAAAIDSLESGNIGNGAV